jgi:hypothetical protein
MHRNEIKQIHNYKCMRMLCTNSRYIW